MKKLNKSNLNQRKTNNDEPPSIEIKKLGIVSHDYNIKDDNNYRDFSHKLESVLTYLDEKGCNSVLFSLHTIIVREGFTLIQKLKKLNHIKYLFVEEFNDKGGSDRDTIRNTVYYNVNDGWKEYDLHQQFGSLSQMNSSKIADFISQVKNKRIMGNCSILLCGESNIVKYLRIEKKVNDVFEYLKAIPKNVKVILNPIHDRMTRHEMKKKRRFLSKNNRWVISVWNKGKVFKHGRTMDGKKPAWTVFHNGNEIEVSKENHGISSKTNIEVGIVQITD